MIWIAGVVALTLVVACGATTYPVTCPLGGESMSQELCCRFVQACSNGYRGYAWATKNSAYVGKYCSSSYYYKEYFAHDETYEDCGCNAADCAGFDLTEYPFLYDSVGDNYCPLELSNGDEPEKMNADLCATAKAKCTDSGYSRFYSSGMRFLCGEDKFYKVDDSYTISRTPEDCGCDSTTGALLDSANGVFLDLNPGLTLDTEASTDNFQVMTDDDGNSYMFNTNGEAQQCSGSISHDFSSTTDPAEMASAAASGVGTTGHTGCPVDYTDLEKVTMIQLAIDHANYLRDLHGCGELTEDPELTKHAQAWAECIAWNADVVHSQRLSGIGENIRTESRSSGFTTTERREAIPINGVNWMHGESKCMDWTTYSLILDENGEPFCTQPFDPDDLETSTGHFTALVWKAASTVGVGYAMREDCYTSYMVIQFGPQSAKVNNGENEENVPKPSVDLYDSPGLPDVPGPSRRRR